MDKNVLVVIGVGGMGLAVARRQGPGKHILLADFNTETLAAAATTLTDEGHTVTTHQVDVGVPESVAGLADTAASLGAVTEVVHTAGLSPTQADSASILKVDLLGVALSLDAFGQIIAPGGAGVVISSMAGYLGAGGLDGEQEKALARTPTTELLQLPFLSTDVDPGLNYAIAKRANVLRVQAASGLWGARGARINSVSPGVISTSMGQQELAGDSGAGMRMMVDLSATKRLGTPDDIASAVAFLLGPTATFISGVDLLVDGGAVAAVKSM